MNRKKQGGPENSSFHSNSSASGYNDGGYNNGGMYAKNNIYTQN